MTWILALTGWATVLGFVVLLCKAAAQRERAEKEACLQMLLEACWQNAWVNFHLPRTCSVCGQRVEPSSDGSCPHCQWLVGVEAQMAEFNREN